MQNCAARLVTGTPRYDHITPILNHLEWLPVKNFITYRVLQTVYKTLSTPTPVYLTELLHLHVPLRTLRSNSKLLLDVPRIRSNFGQKSFSHYAPSEWNKLPENIKLSPTLNTFKHKVFKHLLQIQNSNNIID